MAQKSEISWTDGTFNPWIGCTKVSPGCLNCYADTQDQFRKWTPEGWGKGKPRRLASENKWKDPVKWNNQAICDSCGEWSTIAKIAGNMGKCPACHQDTMRRPRIFCASLSDWLDDEVPLAWLVRLLDLIRVTPYIDWLLLTKRPQNWRSRMEAALDTLCGETPIALLPLIAWMNDWLNGRPPANVWLGTTVEDQERALERLPVFVRIPARVRFVSMEPLLGAVDIKPWLMEWARDRSTFFSPVPGSTPVTLIHWVIVGGESGHDVKNAVGEVLRSPRPMAAAWATALRDQCAAAGVAFHFKQWGEYRPTHPSDMKVEYKNVAGRLMSRVGKKKAGHLLEGKAHQAFPVVASLPAR